VSRIDLSQFGDYNRATNEEKIQFEMMLGLLKKIETEFYSDHTYITKAGSIGKGNDEGEYKFVNDGKYLELIRENKTKEKNEIIEISQDSLKIKSNENIILVYERLAKVENK
jgi:hypothetical protein